VLKLLEVSTLAIQFYFPLHGVLSFYSLLSSFSLRAATDSFSGIGAHGSASLVSDPAQSPEILDADKTDLELSTPTSENLSSEVISPQDPNDTAPIANMPQEALGVDSTILDNQDDLTGGVAPENSSSASSGSSMDESSSSARSISIELQPQADLQALGQPPEQEVGEAYEREMSIDDQPEANELEATSQPETVPGLEYPKPASLAHPEVAISSLSDEIKLSRESSVASEIYEPPEPEYNPGEVYSPTFSLRASNHVGTDPVALLSSSANGTDVRLIQKAQEPISTPASRFAVLDVGQF
jgi:hypothetical protein